MPSCSGPAPEATVAGVFGDSLPAASSTLYWETVLSPEFDTYTLLPSGDTATPAGFMPAATLAGLRAEIRPLGPMPNCATAFSPEVAT